jgi:hypothetical protein
VTAIVKEHFKQERLAHHGRPFFMAFAGTAQGQGIKQDR